VGVSVRVAPADKRACHCDENKRRSNPGLPLVVMAGLDPAIHAQRKALILSLSKHQARSEHCETAHYEPDVTLDNLVVSDLLRGAYRCRTTVWGHF